MNNYTFSIISDFHDVNIHIDNLQTYINADPSSVVQIAYCMITGDIVKIFYEEVISTQQETALYVIVANYKEIFPKVSILKDCTVGEGGDYTSVSAAFAHGCYNVYVKNGLYYETADIVIPDLGNLKGESTGGTVIVLLGGSRVISDGGAAIQSAGSISVSNGLNTVTGVGTAFTNLAVADFILIGTNDYKIASIQSPTELTLVETYKGIDISDASYKATTMNSGVIIDSISIKGTTTNCISFRSVRHSYISSTLTLGGVNNISITDCSGISISSVISYLGSGNCMSIVDSISISLNSINMFNNSGSGMYISGSTDVVCIGSASENNNNGFEVVNSSDVMFDNCISKYNILNGFKTTASGTTKVNGCTIVGNTTGIYNASESIITNNTINDNVTGIESTSGDNIISTNKVNGNTGTGLLLAGIDNIVSSNNLKDNGTDFTDNGIGTLGGFNIVSV